MWFHLPRPPLALVCSMLGMCVMCPPPQKKSLSSSSSSIYQSRCLAGSAPIDWSSNPLCSRATASTGVWCREAGFKHDCLSSPAALHLSSSPLTFSSRIYSPPLLQLPLFLLCSVMESLYNSWRLSPQWGYCCPTLSSSSSALASGALEECVTCVPSVFFLLFYFTRKWVMTHFSDDRNEFLGVWWVFQVRNLQQWGWWRRGSTLKSAALNKHYPTAIVQLNSHQDSLNYYIFYSLICFDLIFLCTLFMSFVFLHNQEPLGDKAID